MIRKYITTTVIILLSIFTTKAQSFDTTSLIFSAKMMMLEFSGYNHKVEFYKRYLEVQPRIKFLNSNGVEDVIFFQLEYDTSMYYQVIKGVKQYRTVLMPEFIFQPIFGFNLMNDDIYRVKGFQINDFDELLSYQLGRYHSKIKNRRQVAKFIRSIYIQNVDVECLFKHSSWNTSQAEIPCLISPIQKFNPISY